MSVRPGVPWILMLLAFAAGACSDKGGDDTSSGEEGEGGGEGGGEGSGGEETGPFDVDEDGFVAADDCDDADAEINPGAAELCDGVDNDCDDEVDEADADDAATWYLDEDGDGYGLSSDSTQACEAPAGYAEGTGDCDDDDDSVNPGAWDRCNGIDDDCDDSVDEDALDGMTLVTIDTDGTKVYGIDPDTGEATNLARWRGGEAVIRGLAANDAGEAYTENAKTNTLGSVDICAGEMTDIGSTGLTSSYASTSLCGLTFGPDGKVYGIDNVNDILVSLDVTTGAATVLGELGVNVGACGMTWDCTNDQLIAVDPTSNYFYTLDASTGAATQYTDTEVDWGKAGLAFDPRDGSLLAVDGTSLYRFAPTSGEVTTVAELGTEDADNLSFAPDCGG